MDPAAVRGHDPGAGRVLHVHHRGVQLHGGAHDGGARLQDQPGLLGVHRRKELPLDDPNIVQGPGFPRHAAEEAAAHVDEGGLQAVRPDDPGHVPGRPPIDLGGTGHRIHMGVEAEAATAQQGLKLPDHLAQSAVLPAEPEPEPVRLIADIPFIEEVGGDVDPDADPLRVRGRILFQPRQVVLRVDIDIGAPPGGPGEGLRPLDGAVENYVPVLEAAQLRQLIFVVGDRLRQHPMPIHPLQDPGQGVGLHRIGYVSMGPFHRQGGEEGLHILSQQAFPKDKKGGLAVLRHALPFLSRSKYCSVVSVSTATSF